jgi:hypothetical protein
MMRQGPKSPAPCYPTCPCADVVHVLFWAVDAAGDATLAVVGTDVRQTGHFVYSVRHATEIEAGRAASCSAAGRAACLLG